MNEKTLVVFVILKLALLGVFALCYVIGGRGTESDPGRKWIRRYLGGITFAAGMIILSMAMGKFNWFSLALLGLYPFGLTLNYGADDFLEKLKLRAIYGLYFGIVGLFCGWMYGVIYLGVVQVFISVAASVFLGVFNPVRATDEEAMLGLAIVIHVPFML